MIVVHANWRVVVVPNMFEEHLLLIYRKPTTVYGVVSVEYLGDDAALSRILAGNFLAGGSENSDCTKGNDEKDQILHRFDS